MTNGTQGRAVRRKDASSFFSFARNRVTRMGASRPAGLVAEPHLSFLLRLDRADGSASVRRMSTSQREAAEAIASEVARGGDGLKTVTLAQRRGRVGGKPIYQDVAAFHVKQHEPDSAKPLSMSSKDAEIDFDIAIRPLEALQFSAIDGGELKEGVRHRKYRKDICRAGSYEKDETAFTITRDVLDHWVTQFSRMKANGVRVPIPSSHDTANDSDANRGYVTEMWRDDDTLFAVCEMIGDDAIAAAERNDCSINVPTKVKDGHGNVYERAIDHVALCPDPVVPGLDAFVPIAASRRGKKTMDLSKLATTVGASEETVESIDETIQLQLSKASEAIGLAEPASLIDLPGQIEDAIKAEKANTAKALKPSEFKADPMLLKLSRDNGRMKLDALVKAGKLLPAIRDKIDKQHLTDEALTLSLSRKDVDGMDFWIGILAENKTVPLGGTTGPQLGADETIELSRNGSGGKNAMAIATERAVEAAK